MDSGVLITLFLNEPMESKALALTQDWLKSGVEIHAPSLFQYEITAVARKSVVRGRTTDEVAQNFMKTCLSYPIIYTLDIALLERAYALASAFNRPTAYDAQYLALAERLKCDFWTADERLFNSVRSGFKWIHWLGE